MDNDGEWGHGQRANGLGFAKINIEVRRQPIKLKTHSPTPIPHKMWTIQFINSSPYFLKMDFLRKMSDLFASEVA
jgi:hypothetical protein